jgi:hypothetical protein
MPPRHRVRKKQRVETSRELLVKRANKRLTARRKAIRDLNALLSEMSLDVVRLSPKNVNRVRFAQALRLLARRCVLPEQKTKLRAAVTSWVDNQGQLPDGILLVPEEEGLQAAPDSVETPALIAHHKVLVSTYGLKSKAFMLTYNSESFTPGTWDAFLQHMKELHRRLGSKAFSCCLEESLNIAEVLPGTKRYHGHGYMLWTDAVGYRAETLEDFRFLGTLPRVDKCMVGANSRAPRQASLHGLYYVHVMKKGTLFTYSNYKPWADYKPSKEWLVSLYDAHKLDHDRYLELSLQFRSGHSARRREVLDIVRDEEDAKVRKHVKKEEAGASAGQPLQNPHTSPRIDEFVNSFGCSSWRKCILVIVGATQFGKTALGRHVLQLVARKLGLPGFLERTMEEQSTIDASEMRVEEHAGILLDGVADVELLKPNRETLQGQAKVCKGGKSSTMMYAYSFTLARRAVVVTMDLSARNLHLLRSDHWLSDSKNIALEWLTAPVIGTTRAPQRPRRQEMMEWSVAQVESFFESQDAAAIGATLAASSVQGVDLLSFTIEGIQEALKVNPFVAQKVCRLRDLFLA